MLSYLWLALILFGVLFGIINGKADSLTTVTFEAAKASLMTIAIPLGSMMAFWLGIMRLAEKSAAVEQLSGLLTPLLKRLFPDIPRDHPAMGAMLMNIAANMLGLGNAATPWGLRAMQHLSTLNPHPGTATNAMCTFLSMNTSSIQLIPTTVVIILTAAGAAHPTAIIGTALIATTFSFLTGITAVKLMQNLPLFAISPMGALHTPPPSLSSIALPAKNTTLPLKQWKKLLLLAYIVIFVAVACHLIFAHKTEHLASQIIQTISSLAIPSIIGFFPLYASLRGIAVYEEFLEGAKEGMQLALKIFPSLMAILVAVSIFRNAGGIVFLTHLLSPLLDFIGMPAQVLPLVLVRPLSGSAATGIFAEIVKTYGANSYIAQLSGTILGGTETTLYVLAIYFGSVAIKHSRHALIAGLLADAAGVIASLICCRWVFM